MGGGGEGRGGAHDMGPPPETSSGSAPDLDGSITVVISFEVFLVEYADAEFCIWRGRCW